MVSHNSEQRFWFAHACPYPGATNETGDGGEPLGLDRRESNWNGNRATNAVGGKFQFAPSVELERPRTLDQPTALAFMVVGGVVRKFDAQLIPLKLDPGLVGNRRHAPANLQGEEHTSEPH